MLDPRVSAPLPVALSVPRPALPMKTPPVDVLAIRLPDPDRLYVPTADEALPMYTGPVEVTLYAGWFSTPVVVSPTLMPV